MKRGSTKLMVLMGCLLIETVAVNATPLVSRSSRRLTNAHKVNRARIDMSSVKAKSVMFGFNKAKIDPDFYPELNRVVKLASDNSVAVKLGGNADNVGAYVYNWKLSEARANAVKQYLVSKGIDSARVAATGFGDTKPIASNRTKNGRLKNRRVDIQFAQ